MRIGLVANTAWNIYHYRRPLIQALQRAGNAVFIIAPEDGYESEIKDRGMPFFPLQHLNRSGRNPISDVRLVSELRQLFKSLKLDIVLLFTIKPNIYGSIAANKVGIPAICTVTGLGYAFINKGITAYLVRHLYRRAFRRASVVVFQNDDDSRYFISRNLVNKKCVTIIPGSGVDTDYYIPLPGDKAVSDDISFLYIGRLLIDKGVLELLRATAKLLDEGSTLRLTLIGPYDVNNPAVISRAVIDRFTNTYAEIEYAGPQKDVRSFIRNTDCLILPSYREGMPRAILEAMSMAKPVIATQVPGCTQLVEDNINGYLVTPKNHESLLKAMKKMMALPADERVKMGNKGRIKMIDGFSDEVVIERYLKLISDLT